jgi:hypothetical protein
MTWARQHDGCRAQAGLVGLVGLVGCIVHVVGDLNVDIGRIIIE